MVDNQASQMWVQFGERVRTRREELGWSQEAAAARIEMTRQQWNRIEKGSGTKRATVYRIADALQLPRAAVLDWAGFKAPAPIRVPPDAKLRYYFYDLDQSDQQRLLDIARTFWMRAHRPSAKEAPDDPYPDPFEHVSQYHDGPPDDHG